MEQELQYIARANDLISGGERLYRITEVTPTEVRMIPVQPLPGGRKYVLDGGVITVSRHLVEDNRLFHSIESLGPG
jgi:hypothetical protein